MGLKDRIEDEMIVDTESILEDNFEEANQLFRIFQDGTIDISDDYEDNTWKDRLLIHLIGRQYAFVADKVNTPSLPYDFFYARVDVDKSTVRKYMNKLADDLIVTKTEEDEEWKLVTDNLPEALDRIEAPEA